MRLKPLVPYAVLAVALAGTSACAADPATTPPGASTPATVTSSPATVTSSPVSAAPSGATRTIEVSVRDKTVTPAPAQIDLAVGETLLLVVTTDRDNELHAHGFEAEAKLVAGVPTSVTLTGKEPGVFEVETHDPALTLLTVAVR